MDAIVAELLSKRSKGFRRRELGEERLNWSPSTVLVDGLRPTYDWISSQVIRNARSDGEALRVSAAASKPTSIRAVS